jgi:hypothetical protein
MATSIMKAHAKASRRGLEGMRASAVVVICFSGCPDLAALSNTEQPCHRLLRGAHCPQADGAALRRRPGDEARGMFSHGLFSWTERFRGLGGSS